MINFIAVVFICAMGPEGDYCVSRSAAQWFPTEASCLKFQEIAVANTEKSLDAQGHDIKRIETACVSVDRSYAQSI